MKPTFHRKTNKQKSYDDLNQIQHCGDEGYSLVNHYLLKHIPKPFPVGLGCEGFWWPTHKECFLRSLIRWANYLQGIQHVSCTTTYHIHNKYIYKFCHFSPLQVIFASGMGQRDSVLWVFMYTFPSSTRTSYTWFWL